MYSIVVPVDSYNIQDSSVVCELFCSTAKPLLFKLVLYGAQQRNYFVLYLFDTVSLVIIDAT